MPSVAPALQVDSLPLNYWGSRETKMKFKAHKGGEPWIITGSQLGSLQGYPLEMP